MRHWEERIMVALMLVSTALVVGCLVLIVGTVIARGLPSLNWEMLTQTPQGGYYLGKGGGIANAILGSLALAGGATAWSFVVSLAVVLLLRGFRPSRRRAEIIRLAMDVLWGIPSIVYGAFGFTLLLWLGQRASLGGGIIALGLLEIPILVRGMDEVLSRVPADLGEASLALGATRWETASRVLLPQAAPGLLTAVLLAFGRAIGDSAAVLFTAGYTDRMPQALGRPAASLSLAVFFQLGTPIPEVRDRAYAAALVLMGIVLAVSVAARLVTRRLGRYVIR